MHQAGALTPLQKWAASASDSHFNAVAGAVGGFTSGVVTCPLDVIKTKLQAQGVYRVLQDGRHVGQPRMYNGLVGTASVIWREEGIRGMYRGLGPIIMGYLPTWAVWFTVYNKSKVWMAQYSDNTHLVNFWSSIVAGASSTIVTNPIWVIKTRLMSQSQSPARDHAHYMYPKPGNTPTARPTLNHPWHYRSTLDAARKMYTSEGLVSFYSGLTPALLGLTHVAVQFPTYEYLKTQFTGRGMGEGAGEAHWFGILSASVLSKILASSATYPHEVIRTRLQTQRRPVAGEQFLQGLGIAEPSPAKNSATDSRKYRGIVMTFRTILREEGWRAFYAGLGTNMMRAVPAATVTMLTYEYVMRFLHRAKEEGRAKGHGYETRGGHE
ncbi:mitochondrial carrier protein [Metarhizium album ARSEF 1941]|uniref:Mitochondrial carrier protein n=1 Tax=Metarhizium album (strain ARSEF 1941) TaxID=1081103 RepID=A0A0B2WSG2_METAS|nr:mitochondrial carrier protein [Metarhizium album ARSEF 1941]KHN96564.1 mitochondrial carrier protein [Metarhizium album ARSEF 1941]